MTVTKQTAVNTPFYYPGYCCIKSVRHARETQCQVLYNAKKPRAEVSSCYRKARPTLVCAKSKLNKTLHFSIPTHSPSGRVELVHVHRTQKRKLQLSAPCLHPSWDSVTHNRQPEVMPCLHSWSDSMGPPSSPTGSYALSTPLVWLHGTF